MESKYSDDGVNLDRKRIQALTVNGQENYKKKNIVDTIAVNDLFYILPQDLSAVASRTKNRQYFDRQNYSNTDGNMNIVFRTGDTYINPKNSYLYFTFNPRDDAGAPSTFNFGAGSISNLFRSITWYDKSSKIIDNIEDYNLFKQIHDYNSKNSSSFLHGKQYLMGYQKGNMVSNNDTKYNFAISLDNLLGAYNVEHLIPATLINGSRLTLKLENPENCGIWSDATNARYELTNVSIMCDSYTLTDPILEKLTQIQATKGDQYLFHTYSHVQHTSSALSNQFDINITANKALSITSVSRNTENIGVPGSDSLASEPFSWANYIYRVANHYYPAQRLEYEGGEDPIEQYLDTLYRFKNMDLNDSNTYLTLTRYSGNHASVGANLRSNDNISLAGMDIGVRSNIKLSATFLDNGGSNSRRIDSWVKHARVVKIFPSKIAVQQ